MIQLECSNCRTMLSIDDAFAGGVCRCQFCGTIQTVPKPSKTRQNAADVSKPLFKRKARIESALNPYNDSLAKAVDEMESSGNLSSNALSGLTSTPSKNGAASNGESAASSTGLGSSSIPSPHRISSAAASENGSASRRAAAAAPEPTPAPAGKAHFVPKPSTAAASAASAKGSSSSTMMIIAAAAAAVVIGGAVLWWAVPHRVQEPQHSPATTQPMPTPVVNEPLPATAPVLSEQPATVPVAATAPLAAQDSAAATPAPTSEPATTPAQ